MVRSFRYSWLRSVLDRVSLLDLTIGTFTAERHEKVIDDFKTGDRQHIQTTAARIRRLAAERAVVVRDQHRQQEDLVKDQAARKRRHLPVRDFIANAAQEIWTIRPDGSGRTLQTQLFDANQGIGPVWSPAGDRIVYQRVCGGCREQHDVVLLSPGTTPNETKPVGSEVVLPYVRTAGADATSTWWPFTVSWSPDGQKLLCAAWDGNLDGLVVVDVHGRLPPVVLQEDGDFWLRAVDHSAQGLWIRSWGSWGRVPGT